MVPRPIRPYGLGPGGCMESVRDVVERHVRRLQELGPTVLVADRFEAARREADAADARRSRGEPAGRLDGVPVTVKESIDVAGLASTGGFLSRKGHRAEADDPVVARWRRAGAIVLGKTNVAQGLVF